MPGHFICQTSFYSLYLYIYSLYARGGILVMFYIDVNMERDNKLCTFVFFWHLLWLLETCRLQSILACNMADINL